MQYSNKVVVAGDVIELYEYDRPIILGKNSNPDGRRGKSREGLAEEQLKELEEERRRNEERRAHRAKTTVTRLVNANAYKWFDDNGQVIRPKFFTVTFAKNIKDVNWANKEFTNFKKRLDRFTGKKIEYLAVIEFQKRGAVHYHVIFFNLPFIPVLVLREMWGHGSVSINALDKGGKDCDNVGAYVTKYMTKTLKEEGGLDDRLQGKKSYFSSRGLLKPVEYQATEKEIKNLADSLSPHKAYENNYSHDIVGNIHYTQYNLRR